MRAIIVSGVGVLLAAFLNIGAVHASVQDDVDQAITILQTLPGDPRAGNS